MTKLMYGYWLVRSRNYDQTWHYCNSTHRKNGDCTEFKDNNSEHQFIYRNTPFFDLPKSKYKLASAGEYEFEETK